MHPSTHFTIHTYASIHSFLHIHPFTHSFTHSSNPPLPEIPNACMQCYSISLLMLLLPDVNRNTLKVTGVPSSTPPLTFKQISFIFQVYFLFSIIFRSFISLIIFIFIFEYSYQFNFFIHPSPSTSNIKHQHPSSIMQLHHLHATVAVVFPAQGHLARTLQQDE